MTVGEDEMSFDASVMMRFGKSRLSVWIMLGWSGS